MGKHVAEASARSRAPRDVVWGVLADSSRWAEWGPWHEVSLERQGEPPPEGVGAVRRLRPERRVGGRKVVTREEIVRWEPGEVFGYRLLDGLPIRNYEAQVTLSADGDGTEIHWRSEFDPLIPLTGGLTRRQVQRVLADVAGHVAREAERRC